MTQAFNLSQLANNLNTAGQLDATDGLVNAVPVANGGTGASSVAAARANLNVPTRTGGDASGTWDIAITNGVYTVGDQTIGGTKTFTNGIRFNDGSTQTTAVVNSGPKLQTFFSSGTFTVPAGITSLIVSVYAGGGGGCGNAAGQGGYGGQMVAYLSGLTPGAAITVTVGSGGNGSSTGSAGSGGTSSFGAFVTCTGGGGGSPGVVSATGTATTTGTRLAALSGGIVYDQYIATRGSTTGNPGSDYDCNWRGGSAGGGGGHSGGAGGAAFGAFAALAGRVYGAGLSGQNSASGMFGATAGGAGGGANGGTGGAPSGNNGGGGGGGGGFVMVQW